MALGQLPAQRGLMPRESQEEGEGQHKLGTHLMVPSIIKDPMTRSIFLCKPTEVRNGIVFLLLLFPIQSI